MTEVRRLEVAIGVAGRTVPGDRRTLSAPRGQAWCMALGQTAGAAAAFGALWGEPPRQVPTDRIRALRRELGAIVPWPCPARAP